MPLKRSTDWQLRLGQLIESSRELAFEWGKFDCALHVCNCVRAMTGVDPGAPYRGTYSDEAGAQAIFGSDLAAFAGGIAAGLGCAEVSATFARRGDIVWIDNDTEYGALGIVSLDGRFASCASEQGLALAPMRQWKRSWLVG